MDNWSDTASTISNFLSTPASSERAESTTGMRTPTRSRSPSEFSGGNHHFTAASYQEKLSAAEEEAWKEINELAGGSIQRYHEIIIARMNSGRSGVIYPPEAAIPDEDELVGDKKPGYPTMSLTNKLLAWWTKKQWKIFNEQILREITEATANGKK